MPTSLWYQIWKQFLGVPVIDDVLSSHRQEMYPTTSLDENCIEFET